MGDQKIPSAIERPLPNGVIYDMSTVGHVRITLPKSSTWSSGLHWHETHDEYLKVVKGTIRVRLGDSRQVISATDGNQPEIKVPRYARHEWQRAAPDGEEVLVIERTDPDDNDKAIFFWNLNGVILNSPKLLNDKASVVSRLPARLQGLFLDIWIPLNLFIIFRTLDNIPVFLNLPDISRAPHSRLRYLLQNIDMAASHLILLVASCVGWVLGLQPVQRRYTPEDAYASWHSRQKIARKIK
ncbi:uncharacterized protein FMAN_09432 [Fusarium mangiferae]|uniref:Cupin 2 conserved barrel domain-containing protein n=1 Tax=Fusarium mangiferae TaxID=192010 RepID=A0A1L7T034_FUSMA|nr:uncharacterized protein FMAN_09432 [Fusarium mangiferae]CVK91289.1 uncharacterized protein FMAN_09432 [Fusarium mangiferae]